MSGERANIEKEIFCRALELSSGPVREAYLQESCAGDGKLREGVDALIEAHGHSHLVIDQIVADSAKAGADALVTESLAFTSSWKEGDLVGRYKLRQRIGEGGMGEVWMAQQFAPVKRMVALKIIKLGMDTKEVVARFEAERQALALMDHPGIASVHDGGATEDGRPYFVMELVEGISITTYCADYKLGVTERLILFLSVCQALQHAHQKGVIHRDLKPSNILVGTRDGKPAAKIIDFGVSKSVSDDLTERTLFTRFGAMVGTPAYMSPEQAKLGARDVDTRSDIYSLGVLLYELLVGVTPFSREQLLQGGYSEMQRIIRETDPQIPSVRISTLEQQKGSCDVSTREGESGRIARLLRGELDWIVMRALEKDRERRYESAAALAHDLDRFLNNEVVLASPPSTSYRIRKFVMRNRGPVLFAAMLSFLLVAGGLLSTWLAVKASKAEKQASELAAVARKSEMEARRDATTSREVATFLREMLAGVKPSVALGRDTTILREILDRTAERVDADLKDQPEVAAELKETLGDVYRLISEYEKAERAFRDALILRASDRVAEARILKGLTLVLRLVGKYDEAELAQRKSLALDREIYGEDHPAVAISLNNLGLLNYNRGDFASAEEQFRTALAMAARRWNGEHVLIAQYQNNLGECLRAQGRYSEAEELLKSALSLRRKLVGEENRAVAESLHNLALVHRELGQLTVAESECREVLAMWEKLVGNDHSRVSVALSNLGEILRLRERLPEAEETQRLALSMDRRLFGDEHAVVALSMNRLGTVLHDQGRYAEAENICRSAFAMLGKLMGARHPWTAACKASVARAVREQGKLKEAERSQREVIEVLIGVHGKEHPGVATSLHDLALTLTRQGRGEFYEAEKLFEDALSTRIKLLGSDHPRSLETVRELIGLYDMRGGLVDAEKAARYRALLSEQVSLGSPTTK